MNRSAQVVCNMKTIRYMLKRLFCLLLTAIAMVYAQTAFADTHYVSLQGTNNSPYINWADAATQIQWAVNAATAGDTVLVSNGVYVLTNQIEIISAISLKGFSGAPQDTVINGNYTPGSATTNNRCLLLSNVAAFVSGLTLSNGAWLADVAGKGGGGARIYGGTMSNCIVRNSRYFHTPVAGTYTGGGGIYMDGGTVTVCTIHANIATNGYSISGAGAGMFVRNTGSLVSGCVISNNLLSGRSGDAAGGGASGGGVYMYDGAILESSQICTNDYSVRTALGWGGGVVLDQACMMRGCTVANNRSGYSSGVKVVDSTITNCVIVGNKAYQYGAALYFTASGYVYGTLITSNYSGPTANIYIRTSSEGSAASEVKIDNCRIIGNGSSSRFAVRITSGTNIYLLNSEISANGLGVVFDVGTSGKIRNCLITDNYNSSTHRGGGVTIEGPVTNMSISGCTIVGNEDNTPGTGAGVRFEGANVAVDVSSCIIYSNGVDGLDDVFDDAAPANYGFIQYSCVGINPGFTGAGIIGDNPGFKGVAGGNYRLNANSPCVNRGFNMPWMTNAVDLGGRKRIRYGTVDMGAYELIYDGTIYKCH